MLPSACRGITGAEARRTPLASQKPRTASRQVEEETTDATDPYGAWTGPMWPVDASQVRTLPSEDESDGEPQGGVAQVIETMGDVVGGGKAVEDERRAYERIDEPPETRPPRHQIHRHGHSATAAPHRSQRDEKHAKSFTPCRYLPSLRSRSPRSRTTASHGPSTRPGR